MKQLTPKQAAFCEYYAACGNATQAAKKAGYKKPRIQGCQNLTKLNIQEYIKTLSIDAISSRIVTAQERQEFYTRMMRDPSIEVSKRLRAAELLGKCQGDFVDRVINVDGGKLSKTQRDKLNAELMHRIVITPRG